MTYAAKQDLIDRAGELEISQIADRDGTELTATAAIDAALSAADKRIDAALAVQFTMPLTDIPDVVKSWATAIARYILHRDGAPEHVRNDYKDALADLDRVIAGKLTIPGASGLTPAAGGSGGRITFEGSEPQFTRENLVGWS